MHVAGSATLDYGQAVEVLRGGESLGAAAERLGTSPAALRERVRQLLAGRLPPANLALRGTVSGSVEIVRDARGIPHVFAASAPDVFFGLGFALGQDRLWQLDHYRRRAHGTLSEVIGRAALASDVEARTLGFRRVAEQELARLPAETARVLQAYADGINAAIEQMGGRLPVEFDVLGYAPAPWAPLDTLTIQRASLWHFSGRIQGIVLAEAALRYLPAHLAERFLALELAEETIIPGGYLAGASVQEPAVQGGLLPQGSNQWAVAGARNAAGRGALLATDGHVPYAQPSDRYEAHICGGGYDVLGMTLPGVPTFHNGRNRRVAWGVTNNVSSARDLYVEEVDPSDPRRCRDGSSYVPFEERVERIDVKGAPAVELVVRSTSRGPIVNDLIPSVDSAGDPPLSLRWTGLEPDDTMTVLLRIPLARSAEDFRATLALGVGRSLNYGFADVDGHVGYQMVGRVPVRGRVTRGYRRANDPADVWAGFVPFEQLPAEADPARGWIGSANNPPAPRDYRAPLYGAYADGYRMRRIRTLLESKPKLAIEDMGAFQMDVYVQWAADGCPALIRLLRPHEGDVRLERALDELGRWDHQFDVQSVGASIYQVFALRWGRRIAAERFPEHLRGLAATAGSFLAHELIVDGNNGWFASQAALEQALAETMTAALAWLSDALGPDVAAWAWGRLHPITFMHALGAQYPALGDLMKVGPFPCAGTTGALNQQGFAERRLLETASGPHYRFLADLSDPATALGCNTTGVSGNPGSPHYADQTDDWLHGRYHEVSLDRSTVEAESTGRTVIAAST